MLEKLQNSRNALGLVFMLPAALLLLLFLTYPLGLGVWLGFTDTKVGRTGEWIGLENYVYLWSDSVTRLALFNTIFYTTVASVFKFFLGLWLAVLLNRNIRFKTFFRAVILLPYIVPTALSAIAFWWIYDSQFSIISWALVKMGFIDTYIDFLGTPWHARFAVIGLQDEEGRHGDQRIEFAHEVETGMQASARRVKACAGTRVQHEVDEEGEVERDEQAADDLQPAQSVPERVPTQDAAHPCARRRLGAQGSELRQFEMALGHSPQRVGHADQGGHVAQRVAIAVNVPRRAIQDHGIDRQRQQPDPERRVQREHDHEQRHARERPQRHRARRDAGLVAFAQQQVGEVGVGVVGQWS